MEKQLNIIDLFCGCGGLSLGFENAGFNVLLGIDMWEDALVTYRHNHRNGNTLCADLATLSVEEVDKAINYEKVDVIIGGPPCQGFSIAGKRIVEDDRNKLYKSFVRMVAYFKPKAFVLENVPNILSIGEGAVRESIINDFSELGYKVTYKVLLAADYGVPQNRRRAIFVGMLGGKEFVFPAPTVTQPVTSKEAISDLPEEGIEDGGNYPSPPLTDYQRLMRQGCERLYNHEITIHNDRTKDTTDKQGMTHPAPHLPFGHPLPKGRGRSLIHLCL